MITKVVQANGGTVSAHSSGKITNQAMYYGLSTDAKPTVGVENADIFMEINTGNVFIFDADNKTWYPLKGSLKS